MKKTILTFGLFSLMMVLTSFTSPIGGNGQGSTNPRGLTEIGGNGQGSTNPRGLTEIGGNGQGSTNPRG